MAKLGKSGEKRGKVGKSEKKWRKVAKSGEKWRTVAKSREKWRKVGKSGEKWRKVARCGYMLFYVDKSGLDVGAFPGRAIPRARVPQRKWVLSPGEPYPGRECLLGRTIIPRTGNE